jgi:hypothetical protein
MANKILSFSSPRRYGIARKKNKPAAEQAAAANDIKTTDIQYGGNDHEKDI